MVSSSLTRGVRFFSSSTQRPRFIAETLRPTIAPRPELSRDSRSAKSSTMRLPRTISGWTTSRITVVFLPISLPRHLTTVSLKAFSSLVSSISQWKGAPDAVDIYSPQLNTGQF